MAFGKDELADQIRAKRAARLDSCVNLDGFVHTRYKIINSLEFEVFSADFGSVSGPVSEALNIPGEII